MPSTKRRDALSLELRGARVIAREDRVEHVVLDTSGGAIQGRVHPAGTGPAVLWVGGAGGGLTGPAGGLYPRLASRLGATGVASLRLDYRFAAHLGPCVLDALVGVAYLVHRGASRVALVGHSFGGAVVITAGAASPHVAGVAALSSQTYGTESAPDLAPRPLLLLHGTADEILPDRCSMDIHRRAGEPKRMILYPGCRHGLDECREMVDRDLVGWLGEVLSSA